MAGFNKDYILEKIAETEDPEHSIADLMSASEISEDMPKGLKDLLAITGRAVGVDYSGLGEDGYDAYGLYCFIPDAEDDTCRYLNITITMTENVLEEAAEALYRLINRINGRIGAGAFLLSEDETTLYYRCNIPLLKEADDENTLHTAGLRIMEAVATVAAWIDVLMGVQEGTLSMEECLERTHIEV